jgi:putative cardiolipin synthase
VLVGSQTTALHAKTFAVDGRRLFVGSFNFDPRSVALNTELGFLIDSPELAGQLGRLFAEGLRARAYAVRLAPEGQQMEWLEWTETGTIVHDVEPSTSRRTRAVLWLLTFLPIEWLL